MINKLLKSFTMCLSLLLLVACLTLETNLSIESNGSGRAEFRYNLSTLALDISKIDEDKDILPFPITINDFTQSALPASGISILEYNMTDDGSRYYINSEVEFSSLEQLSLFTGIEFQIEENGSNTLMTVIVFEPSQSAPVSEKTLNILRNKFPADFCSFQIGIPGDILRVEGATFSGSDVSFRINIGELLSSTDTVSFSVEYR